MTISANKLEIPRNVYFLGAGASASGGIPTFSNFHGFREKANEVLNGISQIEGKDLVQRVLHHWEDHFNNYNIEDYYAAIELDEELGYNNSISAENIEGFLGLIIDNLRKKLNTQEYKRLIECGFAEAIITTNWDFLLERSITELQNVLFDDHVLINYGETIEPYYNVINQTSSTPPIFKLHGSLNWGYCEECGRLYYFNRPVYKVLHSNYYGVKCKKHDNVELVPFIVPPTLSKLKTEPTTEKTPYVQLYSIWKKAYDYLKSCEKLCLIGYSFPEADMQMKFFISNALRKNSNLKEVLVVTGPKTDEESKKNFVMRYHSVLSKAISNPKICFYYNGFEEFCKKELDSWSKPLTF
ncbi:MAG: SIR2 family protein [Nitrospira sp.]|nr:SIR2 family protein [Nitrospira sp.]